MNKIEIGYRLEDKYWYKCVRDDRCYVLTHKDSSGYWYECVMDTRGNIITHKDSTGKEISYE